MYANIRSRVYRDMKEVMSLFHYNTVEEEEEEGALDPRQRFVAVFHLT